MSENRYRAEDEDSASRDGTPNWTYASESAQPAPNTEREQDEINWDGLADAITSGDPNAPPTIIQYDNSVPQNNLDSQFITEDDDLTVIGNEPPEAPAVPAPGPSTEASVIVRLRVVAHEKTMIFENVRTDTPISWLREEVSRQLPNHPPTEEVRLIYGGRLAKDENTFREIVLPMADLASVTMHAVHTTGGNQQQSRNPPSRVRNRRPRFQPPMPPSRSREQQRVDTQTRVEVPESEPAVATIIQELNRQIQSLQQAITLLGYGEDITRPLANPEAEQFYETYRRHAEQYRQDRIEGRRFPPLMGPYSPRARELYAIHGPAAIAPPPRREPVIIQLWPFLWVLVRFFFFTFWFLSINDSYTRYGIVVFMLIATILTNFGFVENPLRWAQQVITRRLDGLLAVANPVVRLDGDQPDPAQVAARLWANRPQNILVQTVRQVQRVAILLVASLVPGVAEDHVAQVEAEAARQRQLQETANRPAEPDNEQRA